MNVSCVYYRPSEFTSDFVPLLQERLRQVHVPDNVHQGKPEVVPACADNRPRARKRHDREEQSAPAIRDRGAPKLPGAGEHLHLASQ